MVYENEIVMLIIAVSVLIMQGLYASNLRKIAYIKTLLLGFYIFFLGWISTIAQGFVFPVLLNILEHFCYLVGSIFIVYWCWQICLKPKTN
jgi:hypothetical protein